MNVESEIMLNQNDSENRFNKLKEIYKPENLFRVVEKYTGIGINSELKLELDDIVGVIKKSDPSGNTSNWFVDNGGNLVKRKIY